MLKRYYLQIITIFSWIYNRLPLSHKGLITIVFVLCATGAFSQNDRPEKFKSKKDSIAYFKTQRDIIDMYRRVLGKAPRMKKWITDKRGGKKSALALASAGGFSLSTKPGLVLSANAAFLTDHFEDTKLSSVKVSLSYNLHNQIVFRLGSNLWTRGNKLNLIGDWRYYKYPEYTYGLGGHTSAKEDKNLINYSNLIIHEAVLKKIVLSTYVGPIYNLNLHWSIREEGQADGTTSDFKKYGLTKMTASSGIGIVVLNDNRLNSINPGKGHYAYATFCPYFKFLGSGTYYRSLIIDLRKYISVGTRKNVLAFWSYNWFTFNGNAPYLDLPSTGWDTYSNLGRGYGQSRFRGKNLMYVEAEYRFKISKDGFFGGVVFTNAQSVTDWPANRFRTVYPAVGSGLRFKLNKSSNTNLCIDYAFGLNGSRGLFFNLGEVF